MTRPTRNRLLMVLLWVGFIALGNALWIPLRIPAVLLLLAATVVSYVVCGDFFAARRAMRRKAWVDALMAFERFEQALEVPWKRRMSWLACSVYSFKPAAISRNHCGVVHLENDKLELAKACFDSALEKDPLYAVAHLNLAVVSAKRGNSLEMEQHLSDAKRLGLRSRRAHQRVRAVLKPA